MSFIKNTDLSTIVSSSNSLLNAIITEATDRQNAINSLLTSFNVFTNMNTFPAIMMGYFRLACVNFSLNFNGNGKGGDRAVAVGFNCLTNTSATVSCNVGVGMNCLIENRSTNNTGIGFASLQGNLTGSTNAAIGYMSGTNLQTGSNNTFLGPNTQTSLISCSSSTAIGSNAMITASNQIVIGTTTESVIIPGNLQLPTNYFLSYTALPTFTVNQIGYQISTTANVIVPLKFGITNVERIILTCGVWLLNIRFEISNITNTAYTGNFNHAIIPDGLVGTPSYNTAFLNLIPSSNSHTVNFSQLIRCTPVTDTQIFYASIMLPAEFISPTNYRSNCIMTATRIA